MDSSTFYRDIAGFTDFKGITQAQFFAPMPEDWKVIITDIKGSTKAIEAGRYKDVNTIGAATIVAAHNAMNGLDFPYVFGGDGATLLIPPAYQQAMEKELVALKKLSENRFNLQLRTGMVSMQEIHAAGGVIEVAKFILIRNKSVAIFRGGGLTLAEKLIKGDDSRYEIISTASGQSDLHNLSCRWEPIPSKNGKVVALLVAARNNDSSVYSGVLNRLEELFGGQLDSANPVNLPSLSYRSLSDCMKCESRLHDTCWSMAFVKRSLEIVLSILIFRLKMPPLFFNPVAYTNSMKSHSDYRKFDDMLRMIIDCTSEQLDLIQEFLEHLYLSGDLYYGIHVANHSLMTCFVEGVGEGEHIHFIDGGDGGYAMAAKMLKEQMKKNATE